MQGTPFGLGRHTFTMNPQEGPSRFPFRECIALEEPCCSSTASSLPNKVVIRRRVRGGEPGLNVPLQLVTYKIPSVSLTKGGEKIYKRLVLFISFEIC